MRKKKWEGEGGGGRPSPRSPFWIHLCLYTFSFILFIFSQLIFSLILYVFSLILFILSQLIFIQSHLICILSDLIYVQSTYMYSVSPLCLQSDLLLFFKYIFSNNVNVLSSHWFFVKKFNVLFTMLRIWLKFVLFEKIWIHVNVIQNHFSKEIKQTKILPNRKIFVLVVTI